MTNNQTRAELREKIREAHEVIFAKLKEKFDGRLFPMAEIDSRILECEKTESHHYNENKDRHNTMKIRLYEPHYEFFGIDWSYEYCRDCNKVLNRRGVLTNQITSMAYTRRFDVEARRPDVVATKPFNEAEVLSNFDGGLEVNIYD